MQARLLKIVCSVTLIFSSLFGIPAAGTLWEAGAHLGDHRKGEAARVDCPAAFTVKILLTSPRCPVLVSGFHRALQNHLAGSGRSGCRWCKESTLRVPDGLYSPGRSSRSQQAQVGWGKCLKRTLVPIFLHKKCFTIIKGVWLIFGDSTGEESSSWSLFTWTK